jgi:hypothetical protein
MKSLNHTIRIAFLCFCGYSVWGQSPQFSQNLNTQNPNVCFGDNVTYSTTVLNATYYAFETQNLNDPNWTKISEGNITLASTVIEHTLHGVTSTPTLRVLIVNGTDSVYSNQHSVTVNQPNFDFHPTDLVQCNGEDATFRVASPTAILYQWETSADGGTNFTDLNNTAKFKNVTTSNLTVSQIINDHHGIVFRCRIRDNLGCHE